MSYTENGDTVSPQREARDSTMGEHRGTDDSSVPILRVIKGQYLLGTAAAALIGYGVLLNKVDNLVDQSKEAKAISANRDEKLDTLQGEMRDQTRVMIEQGAAVRGLSDKMVTMEGRLSAIERGGAEIARNSRRP